ncbi:sensor histidine kinase [Streptomyces nymphaeiformis]|uniref:histidine kinase n=1 Tax=Streptomyces nymphaeiformis TaxID=2663842 RepID=A0A7W7U7N8_9ACTN|nr:HAMP domain-containing sensor histidine kinase [Streptomyces nymphaeiformis]MBB4986424.1 signal transduction histidine kinase [Streptomyces nymphaeiformis]
MLRGGTVGRRFTLLYAAGFLGSGIALLALTYLMSGVRLSAPADPSAEPRTAQEQIRDLQAQLADVHGRQEHRWVLASLVALVVMAGLSLVLGRLLAGRVLRPLRLITAATRRISAENLHERLAVTGPADEVKELADTVDGLLERLEASFVAQRRFVGNASHELRTPLATMRASLDVAAAKPDPAAQTLALAGRIRTELDRVDHLLDGFLLLARAEHGAFADRTLVALDGLAREALDARAPDISAKGLAVHAEVRPTVRTRGSAALLSRMVQNLVDNAIAHNEENGWIRVTTDGDGGAGARLVVETGGHVLDQDEVDRLGRPFERLGAARTGSEASSGLGLSIVAAIVGAHGGRLVLLARPEGGLRVTVTLPSAAPEHGTVTVEATA